MASLHYHRKWLEILYNYCEHTSYTYLHKASYVQVRTGEPAEFYLRSAFPVVSQCKTKCLNTCKKNSRGKNTKPSRDDSPPS